MKVLMLPHLDKVRGAHGGISRVIEAYYAHLPASGIQLVPESATSYDLKAVHVMGESDGPLVLHCHGLYFINDYPLAKAHFKTNAGIIHTIRHANEVTVPSPWVAKTFQRDMRFTPHIVPHGIDWDEWQSDAESMYFILWAKNRPADACDPAPVTELARMHPDQVFVSTFATEDKPRNVQVVGTMEHPAMKRLVQRAGVYLSTSRETFGISTLEAMACAVPILGWNIGGNRDLVQHGVNGYLAPHGNYEALSEGLIYCLENRQVLGENGRELAKAWAWEAACEKVAEVYRLALAENERPMFIDSSLYKLGVSSD